MDSNLRRKRIAEILRKELLEGTEEWYYISIVKLGKDFVGAAIVPGYGPTDAWSRCHALNLIPDNCETSTMGPLPRDKVEEKLPPERRLVLLTKSDMTEMGII